MKCLIKNLIFILSTLALLVPFVYGAAGTIYKDGVIGNESFDSLDNFSGTCLQGGHELVCESAQQSTYVHELINLSLNDGQNYSIEFDFAVPNFGPTGNIHTTFRNQNNTGNCGAGNAICNIVLSTDGTSLRFDGSSNKVVSEITEDNTTHHLKFNILTNNTVQMIINQSTDNIQYEVGYSTHWGNISFITFGYVDHSYTIRYDNFTSYNGTTYVGPPEAPTLTNCTIGSKAINFTIVDEKNGSRIMGDSTSTFNFNRTSTSTESLELVRTNQENYSVCITPPDAAMTGDYTVSYSKTGYQQRQFLEDDAIYSSTTQTITLSLLEDSAGITGNFRVIDAFQDTIKDVIVEVKIESSNTTIEVRKTDDSGFVSFWLDPDTTYLFTFTKSGFNTESFSLRVTSTDIRTVTMKAQATTQPTSLSTGVNYFFRPRDIVLNNNTNYNFTFNLTSSFWNITDCVLRLKNTSQILNTSSNTFNGSQCVISMFVSTGNQTKIISEAEYEFNNTFNATVSIQYTVKFTYVGNFSLKIFFDDIKSFTGGGLNDWTRMFLSFIFIFGILVLASKEITAIRDAESLIILTWALVFLFSYIGWMTLNLETIPEIRGLDTGWLKQWIIFILMTFGSGSFLVRRHT